MKPIFIDTQNNHMHHIYIGNESQGLLHFECVILHQSGEPSFHNTSP